MATDRPLASIIISSYNSKAWLGEAVESALAQTYERCEVLVVDNGSTDGTGEWLATHYGSRIRYLWKEHGVLASGRNFGLKQARGKYIQFLDADDLLRPSKVATHVEYLECHPDVAVVYTDCLCFPDDKPDETYEWGRKHLYRSGQLFESFLEGGFLLIHMPLSRRESLDRAGPFDESLSNAEDRDFWLRVAWMGATFQYVDGEPLVLYRTHGDSMSQRRVEHGRERLVVTRKIRAYVTDPVEQRRLRLDRVEGEARFAYGRGLVEEGRRMWGFWEMARGILADRRDLDYKLAFMWLSLVAGPARADAMVKGLKRAKTRLFGRSTGSGRTPDGGVPIDGGAS